MRKFQTATTKRNVLSLDSWPSMNAPVKIGDDFMDENICYGSKLERNKYHPRKQ